MSLPPKPLPPFPVDTLVRLRVSNPRLNGKVESVLEPTSEAQRAELEAAGRVLLTGGASHAGVAVRREALSPVDAASLLNRVDWTVCDEPHVEIRDVMLNRRSTLSEVHACHEFVGKLQAAIGAKLLPTPLTPEFVDWSLRGTCNLHCIHFLDLDAVRHHLVIERHGGLARVHQTFVKGRGMYHLAAGDEMGPPTGYTARDWARPTVAPGASAGFRAAHAAWGGGSGALGPAKLRELFALILRLQAASDAVASDLSATHPLAAEEAAWTAELEARDAATREAGAVATSVASPIALWAGAVASAPAFPSNVTMDAASPPTAIFSNKSWAGKPWELRLPPSYAELARLFTQLTGEPLPPYTPISVMATLNWRSAVRPADPARHAVAFAPAGWSIMTCTIPHDD